MKYFANAHRVSWLLLGGAFVLSGPSCGGKTNGNNGSGGESSSGDTNSTDDRDDDGVADGLGETVDLNDDGAPDQVDVDGDGKSDGIAVDTDGDGQPDGAGLDTDDDGIIDAIDTDGDGKPDDGETTSGDGDGDGDGDTGSGGSILVSSGGSSSGGAPTSAGGSASGGSPNQNPGVQKLGQGCGDAGALACAGENQKLQLLCDGSEWVQNGTCSGTEVCDTGEDNRGSCQEPVEGCLDKEPGETYCGSPDEVHSCGPDRLGGEVVEECAGLCANGECRPGDDCPDVGDNLVDCSGECSELASACNLVSEHTCGYVTVHSDDTLPMVVRTASVFNSCGEVPADDCEMSTFYIRFEDPSKAYRIVLSGLGAQVHQQHLADDDWGQACDMLPTSISCLNVRAKWDTTDDDDYSMVGAIFLPDVDGARNVIVEEGRCPG